MTRQRRIIVAIMPAVAFVLIAVVGAARVRSPQQELADVAPPDETVLTEPVLRAVVSRSARFMGSVAARRRFSLALGMPGGVVTRLPLAAGAQVDPGAAVAEVAARPIFAVTLSYPLYRDIGPGATGDDVSAVQGLLRSLGHSPGRDPTGTYGRGTERALERFYSARGYVPPRTVVPSDDDIRAAERAVNDADARLANLPQDQDVAEATTVRADAVRRYEALVARRGFVVSQAELVVVPELPATIQSLSAAVGSPLTGPVMELAAGGAVVNIDIPAERLGSITVGLAARISTTSGVVNGKVTAVQSSTSAAPGGTTTSTAQAQSRSIAAVVEPTDQAALVKEPPGSTLRVEIVLGESTGLVLAVPMSAIFEGADGTSYVKVMTAGAPERLPVSIGVIGDGQVEVSSGDQRLSEGAQVVVGARPPSTRTTSGSNLPG